MKWTEKDIPDLTGKTAVVTGANTGLGFQIALALAKHGCHVVMACRSVEKGTQAKNEIQKISPKAHVEVEEMDLASLESIANFSDRIKSRLSHLSLLINNAAVINIPPGSKTKDGFEIIFGTNYFGPFALTAKLFPLLEADGKARIVTVGSGLHKNAEINFENFSGHPYNRFKAYANSKLADLLFTFELDRRLKANNHTTISLAAHPGYAATSISDSRGERPNNALFKFLMKASNSLFAQSAEKSALPTLYAATAADVKGSEYYGPDGMGELHGDPKLTYCASNAYDKAVAKKLWEVSENQTGVKFDIAYKPQLEEKQQSEFTPSNSKILVALDEASDQLTDLTWIKYGNPPSGYVFQTEPLLINASDETVWKLAKNVEQYSMLSNGAMIAHVNGELKPENDISLKVTSLPKVKEKIKIVNDKLKLICWGMQLPFGMGTTERYQYIEAISPTQCKSYIVDRIPSLVGFFSNLMFKKKIIEGFKNLNDGFKEEAELIESKRLR